MPRAGWANDYVGIPFAWHSIDYREGVSCWGLACLVQHEVFGRDLPRFDEAERAAREGENYAATFQSIAHPVPMDEARAGDLLHMWSHYRGRRLPLHVGVIVEPGKVLHIEENTDSIIEDYVTSKRCRRRIIGAYRVGAG